MLAERWRFHSPLIQLADIIREANQDEEEGNMAVFNFYLSFSPEYSKFKRNILDYKWPYYFNLWVYRLRKDFKITTVFIVCASHLVSEKDFGTFIFNTMFKIFLGWLKVEKRE